MERPAVPNVGKGGEHIELCTYSIKWSWFNRFAKLLWQWLIMLNVFIPYDLMISLLGLCPREVSVMFIEVFAREYC